MDLGLSLRLLWRRKLLILLCAVVAAVGAVFAVYDVRLSPLELRSRGVEYAAAEATLLADQRGAAISDPALSLSPLIQRSQIVGSILDAVPIRQAISRELGVSINEVLISTSNPGQATINTRTLRSTQLLSEDARYRVAITSSTTAPVINLAAQAPSLAEARAVVETTIRASRRYIRRLPGEISIRPVSSVRAGVVNPGADWQAAAAIALVGFFLLTLLALFSVRSFGDRRARRTARRIDGHP